MPALHLAFVQLAVSEEDARAFLEMVIVQQAKENTAAAVAAAAGSDLPDAATLADSLLSALEANLQARRDAVRQLLAEQRQVELAEGLQAALRASRLVHS